MAKIVCFKILHMFETFVIKVFHDPTGFTSKTEFYKAFPSTTYQWINIVAVPLGVIAMVFGFFLYMPNTKETSKKHGSARFTTNSYHDFSQTTFTFAQMAFLEAIFIFLIYLISIRVQTPKICQWIFLIICILLELFLQFHVYAFLGGTCRKVFLFITIGLAILIYPIIYPILSYKEKQRNPSNKIGE